MVKINLKKMCSLPQKDCFFKGAPKILTTPNDGVAYWLNSYQTSMNFQISKDI